MSRVARSDFSKTSLGRFDHDVEISHLHWADSSVADGPGIVAEFQLGEVRWWMLLGRAVRVVQRL